MIKMYNAEVLSKFPVVQHFPFGSLFSWEHDPSALPAESSVHTASQPNSVQPGQPQEGTKAPWANTASGATAAPWAATSRPATSAMPHTTAPWVTNTTRTVPMPDGTTKKQPDTRDNRGR